ncbi:MAG: hypothetical protein K0R69_2473 [Clostridia bacterium]|nr:hypothetical protein [Clostridia bacterium]
MGYYGNNRVADSSHSNCGCQKRDDVCERALQFVKDVQKALDNFYDDDDDDHHHGCKNNCCNNHCNNCCRGGSNNYWGR